MNVYGASEVFDGSDGPDVGVHTILEVLDVVALEVDWHFGGVFGIQLRSISLITVIGGIAGAEKYLHWPRELEMLFGDALSDADVV